MTPDRIGARALRYWETRQAVTSNNLANVSTPGFKAERVFARLLEDPVISVRSETDFSDGVVSPTGRPLDVAIEGEGFLVVETPRGLRWSRGGSLALSADGTLVDGSGHSILGNHGRIVLPADRGPVEITERGEVVVDGALVGTLRLERPAASARLEREGVTLWVPSAEIRSLPEGERKVRQGHLEDSNVNAVGAMVEMIEIQRAYSAVQKAILTKDDVNQTITTQIGRVG